MRGRNSRLVVLGAITFALLLTGTGTASQVTTPSLRATAPSVFGARVEPQSGQTPKEAVRALEQTLGAPLPLVSEYLAWDATFPSAYHQWLRDSGHQLVLLVKLKRADGSRPRWESLANAQPGSTLYEELHGWATAVRDLGGPVYFVFHKEPNEYPNRVNGSAADYRDAWARVDEVFNDVGATNARLVFAMAGAIYGRSGTPDTWYPGDAHVDVIASSGVNSCASSGCSWRSQQQIMAPMVKWAADHPSEQLGVVEGATVEYPSRPKRKATWINNARSYLTSDLLDRMAFYSYWSSSGGGDFRLTTSARSTNAARRWVTDSNWS
jgi:hypothetical protein